MIGWLRGNWITVLFYVLAGLLCVGAAVWIVWPVLHKDIGKQVVTHTNAVVTNQAVATNAAITKQDVKANDKISRVVRRAAQDAGSVSATNSADPGAYGSWVNGLCANDFYKGYADCAGRSREPGNGGAHGGR